MGMQELILLIFIFVQMVVMSFNTSYDFVSGNFYNSVFIESKNCMEPTGTTPEGTHKVKVNSLVPDKHSELTYKDAQAIIFNSWTNILK